MGGAIRKIWAVVTAWHLVARGRNNELSKRRIAICKSCEHRRAFVCGKCGCPLIAMSRLPDDKYCEEGKW